MPIEEPSQSLVQINSLRVEFPRVTGFLEKKKSPLVAVNNVSFNIKKGETLGLVGESGCGKSTLGKAVLRLIKSVDGEIIFNGQSLKTLRPRELRECRRHMQMVFQDPYASLNPRQRIQDILEEPLLIHKMGSASQRQKRILEVLALVGLRQEMLSRYPHQFSGGQRQRIGIARALMVNPQFIVCDEAVSALDVSVQSQILNLLKDLQESLGLTYLFISHDLNVVRHLCDRVVVMYLGRVMEILETEQLKDASFPHHPYTRALLASSPHHHPDERRSEMPLVGELPSPSQPPSGCVFRTRCPEVNEDCAKMIPVLQFYENRWVACLKRDNKLKNESH